MDGPTDRTGQTWFDLKLVKSFKGGGGGPSLTHDPHLWGVATPTTRGCPFVGRLFFIAFLASFRVLFKDPWLVLGE